ncbi:hypothetical protein [Myroides odoratus]|uniref:hypothetical protein n=1 Tax=Myroides odoratus TaxID=256 RepID=UPI000765F12F|nr:hypothetical protein [Myroides odoratus]
MRYNNTRYKGMKYVISLLLLLFIGIFSGIAQTNMTKIKDGTISGSSAVPGLGVILELESANKGFLTPRLTTQQRDAIAVANRTDGLLIYNKTTGCFNYWSESQDNWLSLCGTPPPAVFDITALQCNALTVNGTFKQGDYLTSSNYLTVPVTVTQAGTYEVVATTNNGYYFTAKGTFPSAGNYTLILEGLGTPSIGYDAGEDGDLLTITLNSKTSTCIDKHVFVSKASVSYEIDCNGASVEGEYMIGRALDGTNKMVLVVDVQSTGYWSVTTNTINGYSFRGSGTFTQTGAGQVIELLGTGAPIASGTNSFNLTSNSDAGTRTNCMGIEVIVKPIRYAVDCSNAIVAGIYKQDEAMTASNTVTIKANVLATGETTIRTNTVGGIYFTSGPLSFDTLGERNVVLTAVGIPTTPGVNTFTLDAAPGMIATCAFDVTVTGQPVAYSLTCSTIVVNGTYAPNIAMNATNTMTLSVNVQYPGAYTISTNAVNGVTFSASGTFTLTGTQDVILQASGTGISGGTHRYTLSTNSAIGANTCNKNVEFIYRKINVLGLGGGAYQPATASNTETSRALMQAVANFGPNGIVKVDGITITNGGTGQGTTLRNNINNNKIDVIVIGYNYTPNAASIAILNDFVKNKKGVIIHSQENDANGTRDLINAIAYSATTAVSGTGTTYTNPILNIDDPLLNGPFGDVRGKNGGSDVNNSYYVTGYSAEFTSLSHQNNDSNRSWMLKHNSLGYVYIGDSGWTAGSATNNSTTIWPAAITSGGAPLSKAYNGGVTVFNSFVYANAIAWAIQYVQENTNVDYTVQ